MSTFYLDLVGGNDASDGTSFANRWKTFTSGATAARIAPGDTIRVMGSPDETLVGNATWTINSKTVTLAGAVTANISTCESTWTVSANVTSAVDSSKVKEGTNSVQLAIAAGFTTGLAAYKALGASTDFSGYQQVSFMINNNGTAIAASTLSLRLCSDVAGVTTVNTIAIPAIPHTNSLPWTPITVDTGGALGSAIQSIALYCDLDPGTVTVQLDNIIACKASSSADALTLTSLIGKVWNLQWVASTTYATNDIRKPTQPNRNGFRYKVTAGGGGASGGSEPTWPQDVGLTVTDGALTWTCEGLEDTWYAVQSINGTSVLIESISTGAVSAGRGYSGATETVSTYKRECLTQTMITAAGNTTTNFIQDSGTDPSPIVISGGWDRTAMTTQSGETWLSGQNGYGCALNTNGKSFLTISNINAVRMTTGILTDSTCLVKHCQLNHCATAGLLNTSTGVVLSATNVIANCCSSNGIDFNAGPPVSGTALTANGCTGNGFRLPAAPIRFNYVTSKNNATSGLVTTNTFASNAVINNLITASNAGSGLNAFNGASSSGDFTLNNSSLTDTTPFTAVGAFTDRYIWSNKHGQTADSHLGTTDGGTIISATDQRNTASGISWKFRPTSTNRSSAYPLRMKIARIACAANSAVSVAVWTRRDNTNIKGTLKVFGGQLTGVGADVTVACAPSINTWTQSSTLTFTPTEAGVIEVVFEVYDGVGTTNNFWIDDLTVTQA